MGLTGKLYRLLSAYNLYQESTLLCTLAYTNISSFPTHFTVVQKNDYSKPATP